MSLKLNCGILLLRFISCCDGNTFFLIYKEWRMVSNKALAPNFPGWREAEA